MKFKITFFILFFSYSLLAQEEKSLEDYQIKYNNKANEYLLKKDGINALHYFHSTIGINLDDEPMTKHEIYARKKVDSLLPIFQEKERKKWKGRWKLKQLKHLTYNYEYIEISDSTVLFFNKDSINIPCRIEKIKIANYDDLDMFTLLNCLQFENNEIWEFTFKKVKREKRLLVFIIKDANGSRSFLLDERGIIKDQKKRKEALKKEVKTYYVLEE